MACSVLNWTVKLALYTDEHTRLKIVSSSVLQIKRTLKDQSLWYATSVCSSYFNYELLSLAVFKSRKKGYLGINHPVFCRAPPLLHHICEGVKLCFAVSKSMRSRNLVKQQID